MFVPGFCYSGIMRYLTIVRIMAFADKVQRFRNQHELHDLFQGGIDHLAVKLSDSEEYEQFLAEALPHCHSGTEAALDSRRIATVHLEESIVLRASDGEVVGEAAYLEIMEPKPHKAGKDLTGIDHCEVNIRSFTETRQLFADKGVPANQGEGEDVYEHTVVVRIDDSGQEIKFSDEPLSQLIVKELEQGVSKKLK